MSAATDQERPSGSASKRGFALPLAILALALVTAAVAASSRTTSAEIVANQAVRAQDKAYQMAEAGLQLFTARRGDTGFVCSNCVTNPGTAVIDSEWTRVSLVGGYADVAAIRIRPYLNDTMPAVFFIKSHGVDTTARMSGVGVSVYAERTVGQYATFRTGSIKPLAAWSSITGVFKNSNNSDISGADGCTGTVIPGLAVPTSEYHKGSAGYADPSSVTYYNVDTLKARVGIDWNAIINLNAIPADITIPGGTWPTSTSVWKVIRVKQAAAYTIPNDANGILIVDNDLKFTSGRDFDGIILVGGRILGTGSQASSGATYSGLNYLLPGAGNPGAGQTNDDSLANTKSFTYNSCNVSTAAALLNKYYVLSNAWLDNVAVW